MSVESPVTEGQKRRGGRRVLLWLVVGLVAAGMTGYILRATRVWLTPHDRARERIGTHLAVHMRSPAFDDSVYRKAPLPERGRVMIIRAIWNALGNDPFYREKNVVPGKLAAIADRLDATQGEDLKTFEGCVLLLQLCDEASEKFYSYEPVFSLSLGAAEGWIPPIPRLGERWAKATP